MTDLSNEILRRAAKLMRERAEAATPGPWERPLDVRNKAIVIAALPEDEEPRQYQDGIIAALPEDEEPRQYQDGIIPADFATHKGPTGRYAGQRERTGIVQCNTWSDGRHDRQRSGRDLEYIAAMHPVVGIAVAAWLDSAAQDAEQIGPDPFAIAVARAYLSEMEKTDVPGRG